MYFWWWVFLFTSSSGNSVNSVYNSLGVIALKINNSWGIKQWFGNCIILILCVNWDFINIFISHTFKLIQCCIICNCPSLYSFLWFLISAWLYLWYNCNSCSRNFHSFSPREEVLSDWVEPEPWLGEMNVWLVRVLCLNGRVTLCPVFPGRPWEITLAAMWSLPQLGLPSRRILCGHPSLYASCSQVGSLPTQGLPSPLVLLCFLCLRR